MALLAVAGGGSGGVQGPLEELASRLASLEPWVAASLLGLLVAGLTSLGGLAAVLVPAVRREVMIDVGLGFSSGVMIVASFTSLLLPAIDMGGFYRALAGFLAGVAAVRVLERLTPHQHIVKGVEGPRSLAEKIRAAWLVALAIIIHNFPEGMAVGFSTVADPREGLAVGLAIGLQDVPEGAAVALPLLAAGNSRARALGAAVLSGLSEAATSAAAGLLGQAHAWVLPYALAFAAGAMVYVVSHEAIPESHRSGHEGKATLGFTLGFIVMLWLDTTLG